MSKFVMGIFKLNDIVTCTIFSTQRKKCSNSSDGKIFLTLYVLVSFNCMFSKIMNIFGIVKCKRNKTVIVKIK